MLCGIYPGPNVPNAEQLQSVLKAIVDDVGPLYDTGITLKTPKYPNGNYMYYSYLINSHTELFHKAAVRNHTMPGKTLPELGIMMHLTTAPKEPHCQFCWQLFPALFKPIMKYC